MKDQIDRYPKPKRRRVYWWKCEDCGETYSKFSKGEPKRGCPTCGLRGVKTFVKTTMGWEWDEKSR